MAENCALDILLVEDDEGQALLFFKAMEDVRSRLRVQHVESVEGALKVLKSCKDGQGPRLLLLDLHLPPRHGLEVLGALRTSQDRRTRLMPVVVLSSSGDEADVLASYEAGANCYLEKPATLDGLREIVHLLESFWCHARLPR
jgi:chemotaxis family two-component system response regulator Rcp1